MQRRFEDGKRKIGDGTRVCGGKGCWSTPKALGGRLQERSEKSPGPWLLKVTSVRLERAGIDHCWSRGLPLHAWIICRVGVLACRLVGPCCSRGKFGGYAAILGCNQQGLERRDMRRNPTQRRNAFFWNVVAHIHPMALQEHGCRAYL